MLRSGLVAFVLALSSPALARDPWTEVPPLGLAPAELVAAAQERTAAIDPADKWPDQVHLVLSEDRLEVAEDGTYKSVNRVVFRPLTDDAARGLGTWTVGWDTWRQSRPEIQARVVHPDGTAYALDPSTVAEASGRGDPKLLGDNKVLQAPLPRLVVGAVVEVVSTSAVVSPTMPGHFDALLYLEDNRPVERRVVTVDAPAGMPLQARIFGLDMEVRRSKGKGRQVLRVDLDNVVPLPGAQVGAPYDLPRYAVLALSSYADWAEVGRAYHQLVAEPLAAGGIESLVAPLKGRDRMGRVAGALSLLGERTRYTGVLFGASRIVPNAAPVTVERGFGDCKDLAVLLIGMLRALDIEARLVLVRTGVDPGMAADLPTMARFNHAIVYVPGEQPLWIDATVRHVPPDVIPTHLEGLPALVIGPDTRELTTIPYNEPGKNELTQKRVYTLPLRGKGTLTYTLQGTGNEAAWWRASLEGEGGLEAAARQVFRSFQLGDQARVEVKGWEDLREPLTITLSGTPELGALGQIKSAIVSTPAPGPFRDLPGALTGEPQDTPVPVPPSQVNLNAYGYTLEVEIHVPEELRLSTPLPPERQAVGGLVVRREVDEVPGLVRLKVRVEASGVLQPDEVEAARKLIRTFQVWPEGGLQFSHRGWDAIGEGDLAAGLAILRKAASDHPEDAVRHGELARALALHGLMDAADRELKLLVSRHPEDPHTWYALGTRRATGPHGRYLRGEFDRSGAIEAAKKALSLDPAHVEARALLAQLYAADARGVPFGPGSEPAEAASTYAWFVVDQELLGLSYYWMKYAFAGGDLAAVEAWLSGQSASVGLEGRVALAAVREGPQSAARWLARVQDDEARASLLQHATELLLTRGDLALVADVQDAAAGLADPATARALRERAEMYRGAAREDRTWAPDDPNGLLPDLIARAFHGDADERVAKAARRDPRVARYVAELIEGAEESGMPWRTWRLVLLHILQTSVEGDSKLGYRVRVSVRDRPDGGEHLYAVLEKGQVRLRAIGGQTALLAEEALDRLRDGERDQALQWMAWATEGYATPSLQAPYQGSPCLHMLRLAREGQQDALEPALLACVAEGRPDARAAERLQDLRAGAASPELALQIDRALGQGWGALSDFDRAGSVYDALSAGAPQDPGLARQATRCAIQRGAPDASARVDAYRARWPESLDAVYLQAELAQRAKDYRKAYDLYQRAAALGGSSGNNNAWWSALFLDDPPEGIVDQARGYWERSQDGSLNFLHTLATWEAREGRASTAMSRLQDALDQGFLDPDDLDVWWLVLGAVAQAAGEPAEAAAAYDRAIATEDPEIAELARRWSSALKP